MRMESEQVKLLLELTADHDEERARRVLRKHKGDVQAAAHAMLEGDSGEDNWPMRNQDFESKGVLNVPRNTPERDNVHLPPRYLHNKNPAQLNVSTHPVQQVSASDTEIIDLTADDDMDPELKKAIALSLEDEKSRQNVSSNEQSQNFRKSDRAPDPSWAMVPSNAVSTNPGELQLMQAIEASLSTNDAEDKFEELQSEDLILIDDRPIALRSREVASCFAALVLQALFYVPQAREKISKWEFPPETRGRISEPGTQEYIMFNLMSLYARMDLTIQRALILDEVLPGFSLSSANRTDAPGELSSELYSTIAYAVETQLSPNSNLADFDWNRLFHLRYANTTSELKDIPLNRRYDTACVRVDIRTDEASDLIACLTQQLFLHETDDISNRLSLFEPSDIVAFQLFRHNTHVQGPSSNRFQFRFPHYVYLDQFLKDNAEVANNKRIQQRKLAEEMEALLRKQMKITLHQGKDVKVDLNSTLYYYESIATKDGPIRSAQIRDVVMKLRKIIARVENEVQAYAALEGGIAKLREEHNKVFDDPSLQKFRYDLRSVLMHDGLYGRNHIYSYVNHAGKWWKTVDHLVSEVSEETVMTDATGVHLDAGPYMLIYSRAVGSETVTRESWSSQLKVTVGSENATFLSTLPPEVAEKVADAHSYRVKVSDAKTVSSRMDDIQTRTKTPIRIIPDHRDLEKRASSKGKEAAMDLS